MFFLVEIFSALMLSSLVVMINSDEDSRFEDTKNLEDDGSNAREVQAERFVKGSQAERFVKGSQAERFVKGSDVPGSIQSGNAANNHLTGTAGPDQINGYVGHDHLSARAPVVIF